MSGLLNALTATMLLLQNGYSKDRQTWLMGSCAGVSSSLSTHCDDVAAPKLALEHRIDKWVVTLKAKQQ